MKLKTPWRLIFALIIELVLLFIIFVILLIGIVGAFLPFMPGLFFVGLAAAIYSLMMKTGHTRLTSRFHPHVKSLKNKIYNLKITNKIMKLFKKIKKKKEEKIREEILKHGLILLGFNTALTLAFFFGFGGLAILGQIFDATGILSAFLLLLFFYLFAGACAIVWYRFGQLLSPVFKDKKAVNASLVVLVSIIPLFLLILVFSTLIDLVGGFNDALIVISFLGLILVSLLAAIFEVFVVSLGAITPNK